VKGAPHAPARGDVVWLQFAPQAGREQSGRMPAVIVSPVEYNQKVGLCICCPITSRVKGYPFEVELPPGLGVTGAVLCDQVKSLDWKVRSVRRIAALPPALVGDIQARIMALIR